MTGRAMLCSHNIFSCECAHARSLCQSSYFALRRWIVVATANDGLSSLQLTVDRASLQLTRKLLAEFTSRFVLRASCCTVATADLHSFNGRRSYSSRYGRTLLLLASCQECIPDHVSCQECIPQHVRPLDPIDSSSALNSENDMARIHVDDLG